MGSLTSLSRIWVSWGDWLGWTLTRSLNRGGWVWLMGSRKGGVFTGSELFNLLILGSLRIWSSPESLFKDEKNCLRKFSFLICSSKVNTQKYFRKIEMI